MFLRFKDLPIEIRLTLWEMALPRPRIVYLEPRKRGLYRCYRVRSDVAVDAVNRLGFPLFFDDTLEIDDLTFGALYNEDKIGPIHNGYGFKSESPAPTLLYVCRESNVFASKSYSRVFGTEAAFPETWFDVERDTLYLEGWPEDELLQRFAPQDLARVQHLALRGSVRRMNEVDHGPWRSLHEELALALYLFPHIETVTFSEFSHKGHKMSSFQLVFTERLPIRSVKSFLERHPDVWERELFAEYEPRVIDVEKFRCHRALFAKGNPVILSMPKIKCCIITTPAMKQIMEQAENELGDLV